MAITEIRPELFYADPAAALGWLDRALGLETELVVTDGEGRQVFAQVTGGVAIVGEHPGARLAPASNGGVATQQVMVSLDEGIDAHCERARAAGARIVEEPRLEFFGRIYTAQDLEGHLWSFVQGTGERAAPPEGWSVRFPAQEHGKHG